MDGFLLHVSVLELRHSADHQQCAYARTTEAKVALAVNDAPAAPVLTTWGSDVAFGVTLAPDDRITITVTPVNPAFYPMEGGFVYEGEGRFRRRSDSSIERANFAPPQTILLDVTIPLVPAMNVTMFQCYLAPISDVTAKVGSILSAAAGGADVIGQLQRPEDAHWIAFPAVDKAGGVPKYERRTIDPRASIRCFELAGHVVPKLVMTTWPKSIDNVVSNLPGLVMIHPYLSGYYASSVYPYGARHLWDAGLKYFGLRGLDPILSRYAGGKAHPWKDTMDQAEEEMGLPHQMAAGGKRAAVVMPVNLGASVGRFAEGDFLHTFLHDMNAWGLRSDEGYFDPFPLGRWAMAGFSSGNQILATILNGNAGNRFIDGVVAEIYGMDPPPGTHALDQIGDAATAWLDRGPGDRRFRIYTQEPWHQQFDRFKASPKDRHPPPAFVLPESARNTAADPHGLRRVVVSTPATSLTAAAQALDPGFKKRFPFGYGGGDKEGHRIVNQSMFVDAMRRSGLPDIDGSRD